MGTDDWYGNYEKLNGERVARYCAKTIKQADGLEDVDWSTDIVEGMTVEEALGALLAGYDEILSLKAQVVASKYRRGHSDDLEHAIECILCSMPSGTEYLSRQLDEDESAIRECIDRMEQSHRLEKTPLENDDRYRVVPGKERMRRLQEESPDD